jgi:hypothetical protein
MLRWALTGGVILAGTAGWASLVSPLSLPLPINPQSGRAISPGMTRAQVQAVLGTPGDYRTHPTYDVWFTGPPAMRTRRSSWSAEWYSDEARVSVLFDASGCVTAVECISQRPDNEHPLDNALWHFRRQWRRWFP